VLVTDVQPAEVVEDVELAGAVWAIIAIRVNTNAAAKVTATAKCVA
jgi:hypothetical protein